MGIKLRNCDKDSLLKKFFLTFDTDNTATGTTKTNVIVPVKCTFESLSFSCDTDIPSASSLVLHVVVGATNVAGLTASTLIDSNFSATAGYSANLVQTVSATTANILPALSNITVNFSASGAPGVMHGVMTFRIDPSIKD